MQIPITVLAIGMPGPFEWTVILVVALLIFGKRLPNVMRSIGGSMREFKKGINEGMPEEDADAETPPEPKENSAPGSVSREKTSATETGDSSESTYEKSESDDEQQRSL